LKVSAGFPVRAFKRELASVKSCLAPNPKPALLCPPCDGVVGVSVGGARADSESCPRPGDEIATDRPDVTNSSIVVPYGSLQSENGINLSTRDGGRTIDGANTRWRMGIAPCLEVLVDVPGYFANVKAPGTSGWTDVVPGLKWQISPLPGKIDLSATVGAALPTGTAQIAGRGAQPYLQFP
jgi:hypothetical protein